MRSVCVVFMWFSSKRDGVNVMSGSHRPEASLEDHIGKVPLT